SDPGRRDAPNVRGTPKEGRIGCPLFTNSPLPKPRWMPLPALRYAQVVKSYQRRRLVGVTHRVVFGTRLAIEQVLATCGWTINTSFVERLNPTTLLNEAFRESAFSCARDRHGADAVACLPHTVGSHPLGRL